MKKILFAALAAFMAAGSALAVNPSDVRIYLNPGHGSWGPNDRPMATIPYPNLSSTGRPDTNGFYESNTNLWKILKMGERLVEMGVNPDNIMYSRVKNGPYPYVSGADDAEIYNRNLTEIAREVDANNMDMFVSVHSNAATDGTNTNYPLYLYRGQDYNASGYEHNEGSYEMCDASWLPHYMDELDPQSHYSRTNKNIRGDWNFYGSTYQTTTVKGTFTGYLGVLRHGTPGFLVEGYFHTYQPARHRALNMDYCHQEGARLARGVCAYFGLNALPTGDIMGTIKDKHNVISNSLYTYAANSIDQFMPLNGAVVSLFKDGVKVADYTVDQNYSGVFVFEGLQPGIYTLEASSPGFKPLFDQYKTVEVQANNTTYAPIYLEKEDYENPDTYYPNYPDPDQEGVTMPDNFNFRECLSVEVGNVKRVLARDGKLVVLTHDANNVPTIQVLNGETLEVEKTVNTNGLVYDTDNLGFYNALSDIAFTANGQLVGCNSVRNQASDRMVESGYKRGTLRFYKWLTLDSAPVEWITTQSTGSGNRSDMGATLAISGSANNCHIVTTAVTSATSKSIRLLVTRYYDGSVTETYYTERNAATEERPFSIPLAGNNLQMNVSPRDDGNFVFNAEQIMPFEFKLATVTATDSEVLGKLESEGMIGTDAMGLSFFKYLQHSFMAIPYVVGNNVEGVKLYDVTDGLNNAVLVPTEGADKAMSAAGRRAEGDALPTMSANAIVDGEYINLYLVDGNTITRFTSEPDEPTGVQTVGNSAKKAVSVKYVGIDGKVSAQPLDGVNIVVTTYDDGTTDAVKTLK